MKAANSKKLVQISDPGIDFVILSATDGICLLACPACACKKQQEEWCDSEQSQMRQHPLLLSLVELPCTNSHFVHYTFGVSKHQSVQAQANPSPYPQQTYRNLHHFPASLRTPTPLETPSLAARVCFLSSKSAFRPEHLAYHQKPAVFRSSSSRHHSLLSP